MLPLERRPGINEGNPLLLELTLGLLAGGTLLPELLFRCDDHSCNILGFDLNSKL
jgi:hypothetical protein